MDTIRRDAAGDLQWTEIDTGGSRFFHLTGQCSQETVCSDIISQLTKVLQHHHAKPILHDEFCSCNCLPQWCTTIKKAGSEPQWPVTWLEGHDSPEGLKTGFQVWALAGCETTPITHNGRVVGTRFEDDEAVYCALGDLRPDNPGNSRGDQAGEVFNSMLEILQNQGMSFDNVARTWLYLDHILDWYDDFNVVRNAFFEKHGIFDRLVPASTGIGCAHPAGTAMIAKLLAVRPKNGRLIEVESPLQCPATDYRSAFSRAVELQLPSHRQLYISGTASIEPGGATIHVDDTPAQLELTMKVVQAILESRGMDWTDTVRGIAYFRNYEERKLLDQWLAERKLSHLPIINVQSDVCRDDLLYEIELDAILASDRA